MAAVLGRTELGIREIGQTAIVPNDPRAKLMYYLNCMCSVLDLQDQQNLTRLRKFSQHNLLTEQETDELVALCFLLSPDELHGKVIFQDDEMCGDSNNKFYELSAVQTSLLVSDSILIGGQRRAVHKIMAFKKKWLHMYWVVPMKHFAPRLARIAAQHSSQPQRPAISYQDYQTIQRSYNSSSGNGCCCVIL